MGRAGVTLVTAAGNWGSTPDRESGQFRKAIDTFSPLFVDPDNGLRDELGDPGHASGRGYLPDLIVVGAAKLSSRGRGWICFILMCGRGLLYWFKKIVFTRSWYILMLSTLLYI